jgi:hypothetical protein
MFKEFFMGQMVESAKIDIKSLLKNQYITLKSELDKEDIEDGGEYFDIDKIEKYLSKLWSKYKITPSKDSDFMEMLQDFIIEIGEKDVDEWKQYKLKDFYFDFEDSDLYDEFANETNFDEAKVKSLLNNLVKTGEYKKPTSTNIKNILKDVKNYDPAYSDKEIIKMAADREGLRLLGGKPKSVIIKIVASDKYSFDKPLKTAERLAKKYKGIKVSKDKKGIKVSGPGDMVSQFVKLHRDEIAS